jgi:hypothetical protein
MPCSMEAGRHTHAWHDARHVGRSRPAGATAAAAGTRSKTTAISARARRRCCCCAQHGAHAPRHPALPPWRGCRSRLMPAFSLFHDPWTPWACPRPPAGAHRPRAAWSCELPGRRVRVLAAASFRCRPERSGCEPAWLGRATAGPGQRKRARRACAVLEDTCLWNPGPQPAGLPGRWQRSVGWTCLGWGHCTRRAHAGEQRHTVFKRSLTSVAMPACAARHAHHAAAATIGSAWWGEWSAWGFATMHSSAARCSRPLPGWCHRGVRAEADVSGDARPWTSDDMLSLRSTAGRHTSGVPTGHMCQPQTHTVLRCLLRACHACVHTARVRGDPMPLAAHSLKAHLLLLLLMPTCVCALASTTVQST